MATSFAVIDGNSFYCSCERVFDPALEKRPVIVLSNNDGCAVARTAEARVTTVDTDRCGDPTSCVEVWKNTVTWSVPSPPRRSFSPRRAAWVAMVCIRGWFEGE